MRLFSIYWKNSINEIAVRLSHNGGKGFLPANFDDVKSLLL
jgi:hypothetical protein